ncbi:MAG: alpha/beta hydrolase [Sphingomicrobium sp.]
MISGELIPIEAIEEHEAPSPDGPVRLRLYRPVPTAKLAPTILFLHGGGFVIGSLDSHDDVCRALALGSHSVVVAVDYRLAPETVFPGALGDCRAALQWLADSAEALSIDRHRLALCGDSAGGNLAIGTALWARGHGIALRHLGLLYPVIDPACETQSMRELGNGFVLTQSFIRWFWAAYLGEHGDPSDPCVAVLEAHLADLPPLSLSTAEFDPLREEGEAFGRAVRAAGVSVIMRRYLGMIHGFANLRSETPVAARAIADLAADLASSLTA